MRVVSYLARHWSNYAGAARWQSVLRINYSWLLIVTLTVLPRTGLLGAAYGKQELIKLARPISALVGTLSSSSAI